MVQDVRDPACRAHLINPINYTGRLGVKVVKSPFILTHSPLLLAGSLSDAVPFNVPPGRIFSRTINNPFDTSHKRSFPIQKYFQLKFFIHAYVNTYLDQLFVNP